MTENLFGQVLAVREEKYEQDIWAHNQKYHWSPFRTEQVRLPFGSIRVFRTERASDAGIVEGWTWSVGSYFSDALFEELEEAKRDALVTTRSLLQAALEKIS